MTLSLTKVIWTKTRKKMKTINILSCLFVAVIACMGCSKEHDNEVIEATGTHTVTFMAQKEIETRTYVVEGEDNASYYWDLNDNQYFYIYENGILPISREMILSEGGKVASFRATFRDTDATSFTYSAIYARDITSSGDVCVPNYQYPPHLSFDPEADVLVSAETVSLKDGVRLDKDTTIQFKMKRLASVNKITVKGINPGEKVVGVALYADQPLGGYFCYDGEGTRFDLQKELFLDLYNWDETDRVVGADGSLSVYFLSLPITRASTTVRVWTEKNIYKRALSSKLTLETGIFRRFGVTMREVSPRLDIPAAGFSCWYNLPLESSDRDKVCSITNMGDRYTAVCLSSSNTGYYSFSPASFGLNPGESIQVQVHFSFYSERNLVPSDAYGSIYLDPLLVETDAFTYELPVHMDYGAWEEIK